VTDVQSPDVSARRSLGAGELGAGSFISATVPQDDAAELRAAIARVAARP
jgi:hypothetical protein